MSSKNASLAAAFCAGSALTLLATKLLCRRKPPKCVGDELNLYYGDVEELTTVTDSQKFLPEDLYGRLVRDCIVFCVDVVLVRTNPTTLRKECLLVQRVTEPAKGVWWWPGGRMLKGETFFDAAKRKAKRETGLPDVTCLHLLGIWNTVFPRSHWDTESQKGTQTVNVIVLAEINDLSEEIMVKLDETSSASKWIHLDFAEAEQNGEDKYVLEALRKIEEWDPTYMG